MTGRPAAVVFLRCAACSSATCARLRLGEEPLRVLPCRCGGERWEVYDPEPLEREAMLDVLRAVEAHLEARAPRIPEPGDATVTPRMLMKAVEDRLREYGGAGLLRADVAATYDRGTGVVTTSVRAVTRSPVRPVPDPGKKP